MNYLDKRIGMCIRKLRKNIKISVKELSIRLVVLEHGELKRII